jgi:hypothetical protein
VISSPAIKATQSSPPSDVRMTGSDVEEQEENTSSACLMADFLTERVWEQ